MDPKLLIYLKEYSKQTLIQGKRAPREIKVFYRGQVGEMYCFIRKVSGIPVELTAEEVERDISEVTN
jgi:hypothetical protein